MAYTGNRKLGNLEKCSFTSIFSSKRNSKSKNQKNDLKQEKCNFKMRFNKKGKIQRFQVFNSKPGKFSFALNFDCFDCIKCQKAENFHLILKE